MNRGTLHTNREGGFALVLSLILTTVVAGLCMGFVRLAEFTARGQSGAVDQMRAFYLAEAGLAEGFNAVRMGRNGSIGTEELPAAFGDGLVWVESRQTTDSRVWLRSTATVRNGSATLGLIIDPEEPPLGFFADEELVIESSLVVDGFDSTERSYSDEVAALEALHAPEEGEPGPYFEVDPSSEHLAAQESANRFASLLGSATLLGVLDDQILKSISLLDSLLDDLLGGETWVLVAEPVNVGAQLSAEDFDDFLATCNSMMLASDAGALLPIEPIGVAIDPLEPDGSDGVIDLDSLVEMHTGRGGMLGSNGNIEFLDSLGAAVFGSVMPGVGGQVLGVNPAQVSGSTISRAMDAVLPPVVLPDIAGAGNIEHMGLIPLVIGEGETRLDSLWVGGGSEVIIRGPVTLMVHELVLDGGSTLSLDTRDGDVELFVTGTIDMDPASYVATTALSSAEVSISAAAAGETDPAPELRLDAHASFHGTVYAPTATVHIGSSFEIFGSVAARRLEIASGARLHYDDESFNGQIGVPTLDSWKILDLPDSVRGVRSTDATVSSMAASAVNPPLATAHDLGNVEISLRYTDKAGAEQTYAGPEAGLDWSDVEDVEAQERRASFEEADDESQSRWNINFTDILAGLAKWFASLKDNG